MPRRLTLPAALIATALPAVAQQATPPLLCGGADPVWNLVLDDGRGTYTSPELPDATAYDVRLSTPAQGRDWPRALTLIGPRDTAIVLLDRARCAGAGAPGDQPYTAHLMTQRGTEAILLTGCCRLKPAN
ncbi:MAG: hypothetical protein AAGD47_03890 [Pseudomonadota bacterium]